jgi:Conjugative transposon protein TcpC
LHQDAPTAAVTVTTVPLWRIRLSRELPRYLLCALAAAGLAASVRFAVAPPRPVAVASTPLAPALRDRAAEGYAALFARRYLTWNAAEPQASQRSLESFAGSQMETNAGLELPSSGQQKVEWVEVVQERTPAAGEHVYTLAAQTDAEGLLYLTVSVVRTASGALALAGYPAFVGPPAAAPAQGDQHLREVMDAALATVVARALHNYLAGSGSELAADLANGARVSLPSLSLELESVQRLDWTLGASSVLAVVQAQDERGVQYTLAYELDVMREQGRWEVSAIQTDPDA